MEKAKRVAKWVAFNGVVVAVVYLACNGVEGAARVLPFICWFVAVAAWVGCGIYYFWSVMVSIVDKDKEENRRKCYKAFKRINSIPINAYFNYLLDWGVVGVLAWHGFTWSALAYLLHIPAMALVKGLASNFVDEYEKEPVPETEVERVRKQVLEKLDKAIEKEKAEAPQPGKTLKEGGE